MRIVWVLTFLAALMLLPQHLVFAQEGEAGAEAAEEGDDKVDAETARREALRRMRMGNVAKLEVGEDVVQVSYGETPSDGPDYPQVASASDGDVIKLTKSIVTKLKTDLDLQFGETKITTGNVAENYPGVYGLWLKRAGDGWRLVFNQYADVWGTQHFPDGDVAETPIAYSKAEEAVEKLTINIAAADNGGILMLSWGEHQWTASFEFAD